MAKEPSTLKLMSGTLHGVPDRILSPGLEERLRSKGYDYPKMTPFSIWGNLGYMAQTIGECIDGDMAKVQQRDLQHVIDLCERNARDAYYDSRNTVVGWLQANKIEYDDSDLDYYYPTE